jgi:hypothetical protein
VRRLIVAFLIFALGLLQAWALDCPPRTTVRPTLLTFCRARKDNVFAAGKNSIQALARSYA